MEIDTSLSNISPSLSEQIVLIHYHDTSKGILYSSGRFGWRYGGVETDTPHKTSIHWQTWHKVGGDSDKLARKSAESVMISHFLDTILLVQLDRIDKSVSDTRGFYPKVQLRWIHCAHTYTHTDTHSNPSFCLCHQMWQICTERQYTLHLLPWYLHGMIAITQSAEAHGK